MRPISSRNPARVAAALLTALFLLAVSACGNSGGASAPGGGGGPVVIGAAWPLSGPFAFNGNAVLAGAKAAVTDINAAGGIKALGGAPLELQSVDAGSSAQDTSAAVRRLVADDDVVAVMGSWLSSLSLAGSEVTERAGVPYISESFADEMTSRQGFSHVFDYAARSSEVAGLMLDAARPSLTDAGLPLQRVALIGDNTAAATPLLEALAGELAGSGTEVAMREQWTPPLQDASGIVQRVAAADVDAVFLIAYSFNDVSTMVRQLRSQGVDVPVIQNGGQAIVPQWRDFGDDALGLSTFVYTNPLIGSKEITDRLAASTGVPYVWQDQIGGYFAVHLIAAALEQAGSADREALNTALHAINLTEGPAVDLMPADAITFDEGGRLTPSTGVLAQWQRVDGQLVPCTVFPVEHATCEPSWQR